MKIMRIIYHSCLSIAIVSLLGFGASAQTSDRSSQPMNQTGNQMSTKSASTTKGTQMSDDHFIKKAAEGGLAEVEFGKVAEQKATNPEVKKFAERMVTDHSKANDELKQVASSKGITPPDSLDAKDKATKQKLESLSGEQFDRAYMRDMVTDHTKDVAEFKHESQMAKDPAVKNFASQTLPTLESHLHEARRIEPQVMKTPTKSSMSK